jgi:cyclopropane fatty-acyl-phospholipid synthase-like methyltransferase
LDLGGGGGVHTVFLAQEGFTVTGEDFSTEAIRTTRFKLERLGFDAVLSIQSLETLDLPHASFDLVISIGVLDAAGPRAAAVGLGKLPALLRPDALGLFLFAASDDFRIKGANEFQLHGYKRSEVEALFSAGFGRVWIDEYVTTYYGGEWLQHDWLVTIQNR